MKKSQSFYYEDVVFQLELNLQTIRRDLISLLEDYNDDDCNSCKLLKCCCSDSLLSTSVSTASSDSAVAIEKIHTLYITSPPPQSLPTPRWPENKTRNGLQKSKHTKINFKTINAWIKASIPNVTLLNTKDKFPIPKKVLDRINYSWPPFPKSVWSKDMLKVTIEREDMIVDERDRDVNNSVEAFFKHFDNNQQHNNMFVTNNNV